MGYDLLKSSFEILMLFTPEEIAIEEIVQTVNALPSIKNMHHVHVWQLNEEETHLEAHIDFSENIQISEFGEILHEIERILRKKYAINHVTLQPEYGREGNKDIIVQD